MNDDVAEATAGLAEETTFGLGSVHQIPEIIASMGGQRVLLVCGRRSFEASGAATILPELRAVADIQRFSEFSPNANAADVEAGLTHLRKHDSDVVLAIGGGSAMDLAKLLCAYQDHRGEVHEGIRSGRRIEARRPALILTPTTSGSGSEATHFAVVYVDGEKHSVAGPAMLADHIILDPELSRSATAQVRAASGVDALCQSIESLWAVGATDESRAFARRGLSLTLEHLQPFVRNPSSDEATAMCLGSHLAGRAINTSKTTAPHALSYALTQRHGIAHGHAVALTLGPVLEAHAAATPGELQRGVNQDTHAEVMTEILAALGASDGRRGRSRFTELLTGIGLEPRLSRLGIDGEEHGSLAASVNVERLGNNPVAFDEQRLRDILRSAA